MDTHWTHRPAFTHTLSHGHRQLLPDAHSTRPDTRHTHTQTQNPPRHTHVEIDVCPWRHTQMHMNTHQHTGGHLDLYLLTHSCTDTHLYMCVLVHREPGTPRPKRTRLHTHSKIFHTPRHKNTLLTKRILTCPPRGTLNARESTRTQITHTCTRTHTQMLTLSNTHTYTLTYAHTDTHSTLINTHTNHTPDTHSQKSPHGGQ